MIHIEFYDKELVVCQKPRGALSEGAGDSAMPTLIARALEDRNEEGSVFCVHRLDRETTGLMVYARTQGAAAALSRSIVEDKLEKDYLAVTCGCPEATRGRMEDLLFYDRARGKSFVVDRQRKGVKRAVLEYEVVVRASEHALVRVHLLTGRTHQIRVQFASRGMPLAGDRRYGAPAAGVEMGLHACRLRFPHPKTGEILEFISEPPKEESCPFFKFFDARAFY